MTATRSGLSVGAKLAAVTVAILTVVAALVTIELATRERATLIAGKQASAAVVSDLFAAELVAPLDFADEDAIRAEVDNLRASPDVLWAAVFPEDEQAGIARASYFREGVAPFSIAKADAPSTRVLEGRVEVARRIVRPDGAALGTVVIAVSLAPEEATFRDTRRRILLYSLAIAAATAALFMAASRRLIVRPLERLMVAAGRIERGEREVRVAVTSGDELGRLAGVFNQMSAAIVEREGKLAEATRSLRELFDHMRQGIVVFRRDGVVEETASAQAEVLFGETAGRSIRALLYPSSDGTVEVEAFDEWLRLAFEVSPEGFEDVAALAPSTVRLPDGDGRPERVLSLEFEPIEAEGRVARVMMLASDVTEVQRLEETVRVQEEEHARRMRAMRRLVTGGGQVFVAFLAGARDRLDRCRALLASEGPLAPESLEEVLRHAHTVKGEASAFDLAPVVEAVHALEDELIRARARSTEKPVELAAEERNRFLARLDGASQALDRARDMFVEASPIGPTILELVTVHRGDVEKLFAAAGSRDDDVGRIARRLAARPFGEQCAQLAERVPTWAGALGKSARLEVEGREVPVPRALAEVLPGALAHLVRNAVVHGIEVEAERAAAGKEKTGCVRLACRVDREDAVEITVSDDGGGIDVDELRRRARGASAEAEELPFSARASTAQPGALAGRGVGLAAVRALLDPVGYRVRIASTPGSGTRVTIDHQPARIRDQA